MKILLIFFLSILLVWCTEISYKHDTQDQIGKCPKPINHTIFYQIQKNRALEQKYQEREQKYNTRNLNGNSFDREDNVPILYMWRLENRDWERIISDFYYDLAIEKWIWWTYLGTTSWDYIYVKYPQERYVSISNHSGWNLKEVVESGERHVFSITSAPHPEYEIYDPYSPVSERYIVE